jgi:hypothetical protein
MVKGISRQVIVVDGPDPKLFDQAIFILKNDALGEGITEEALLKEARQVIRGSGKTKKRARTLPCIGWSAIGAALVGIAWAISVTL